MPKALVASIVVLSGLSLALLWLTDIPLGIPGEWVWNRIIYDDQVTATLLGLVQTAIVGVIYLAVASYGLRRIAHCRRLELTVWLGGLTLAGLAWLIAVQEGTRLEYRLSKAPFVLYYPASSGYFHTARYDIESVPDLLRTYEHRMEQGDVLHEGTHPPGLFALYRGLITANDSVPALNAFAEATMTDSFREATETIRFTQQASQHSADEFLQPADGAVLWLATVLTMLSAVAALVPLFLLVGQTESRRVAWQIAALWPLIPTVAVFVPKSDVLFLFPATLLVMFWMLAVRRQSSWLGLLAGLIGWCCLCFSLVFLPVGLAAFLAGWFSAVPHERPSLRGGLTQAVWRIWLPVLGGVLAVVLATVAFSVTADMNLVRVWWLNAQNHSAFYDQFSRTMGLWLLVNPLELALAVGAPIMCIAVTAMTSAARERDVSRPIIVAVALVWGLLWISGRNSGEVARLWIPLLPLLFWAAAAGLRDTDPQNEDVGRGRWLMLAAVQMLVCTATVLRVGGFHFSGITE